MQSMCAVFILNGMCFCCIWLTIPFWGWLLCLSKYWGVKISLVYTVANVWQREHKIPNEAADWLLVIEILYIKTVGLK